MSVASPRGREGVAAGTPPSAGRRLRYKLRIAASEPTTLIGILMAALFAYLIVVPIIAMLLDAATVQLGDQRRIKADVGGLTWYYLERTFTSRVAHNLFWGPLVNTLSVAFGAIVARDGGRRDARLAAGADRHVRPQVVRDRADRALHAAGLDLRAGLDDAVQEPHRGRAGGMARDASASRRRTGWPTAGCR